MYWVLAVGYWLPLYNGIFKYVECNDCFIDGVVQCLCELSQNPGCHTYQKCCIVFNFRFILPFYSIFLEIVHKRWRLFVECAHLNPLSLPQHQFMRFFLDFSLRLCFKTDTKASYVTFRYSIFVGQCDAQFTVRIHFQSVIRISIRGKSYFDCCLYLVKIRQKL